jgi:hypothetical protein
MKNTISKQQKDELWELFTAYTATHKAPEDFWTLAEVLPSGDSVSDEVASYIEVTVQDYDGHHDFDFVRRALLDVGVEVDEANMLCDYDLAAMEREDEPRPLKGAVVTGDGEYGRLFGYQLVYTH